MEPLSMIYPPNRPLERPMEPSKFPVMYDYLLFIDSNAKGELIIGSSNIAGTYWEGTLQFFKNFEDLKANRHSGFFISNTTTSDAVFIDDDNVLLCEDNGTLLILNTQQNGGNLLSCQKKFLKSHRLEKISTWGPSKLVACYDYSIDLYNIESDIIALEKCYSNYHIDLVKCVDTNRSDWNLFASCAMDRKACIWDVRLENPATVIFQNEFCPLNSITWNSNCTEQLLIGSDSGDVYLVDRRKPNNFLNIVQCFNSSVHKMAINDNGYLAVCGDTSTIAILRCGNGRIEKCELLKNHNAIVRGVSWSNDRLFSCGFNKEIFYYDM